MNQVMGGTPSGISSLGFHGETVITILIFLAMMALAVYAGLQCLKKGVLCPSFLTNTVTERHMNRNFMNRQGGFMPVYPDLAQMSSAPLQPPRMAILPGEYIDGKCWVDPANNFNNGYQQQTTKFHPPAPPPVFQSLANSPSFVVPQTAEKCG